MKQPTEQEWEDALYIIRELLSEATDEIYDEDFLMFAREFISSHRK